MKDRIETIIRDWLNVKFNNPNAIPSLMLKGIAEEICKHAWEIHRMMQDEYDLEDIEMTAKSYDIELSEEEKQEVLHRYQKMESSTLDDISFTIDYVVGNRKNKNK